MDWLMSLKWFTKLKSYSCKRHLKVLELVGKTPSFRPKNSLFLRNRGRWFRIWSWFARQSSSFGDICILPPEICTRSTRTSWSCTPWSQFFYSNFFSKLCNIFTFIKFMRVLRVYVGYLLNNSALLVQLWCTTVARANQDQIRNQRPRLRRNRLFLGRKEGGFPTSAKVFT